jgi:YegS/Rv2252/BmrU family lipid kinase
MTKFFVIFNPAARGEKSRRLLQFLQTKAAQGAATLAATSGPGNARQLAAQAVQAGYSCIVAAGGDGTVNEVVNGIGRSGVPLGILPLGTVNVFTRELGISRNLGAAWAVIERGHVRTLDLPLARFGDSERCFVQLAGVGFDAAAVRTASWELKKRIGPLSYVWAGLKAMSDHHADVEVRAPGETARGVAVLIGNGRFYGGSFRLFPDARPDDGRLDVCVFETVNYFDVLRHGLSILRAAHVRARGVKYFQAAQITCTAPASVAVELDGEDVGQAPVEFTVAPQALRVVVPENCL